MTTNIVFVFILILLRGVARRKMAASPQSVVRSIVTSKDSTHSAALRAVPNRTAPKTLSRAGSTADGRAPMCPFLDRDVVSW
jgi:hypothetical protein